MGGSKPLVGRPKDSTRGGSRVAGGEGAVTAGNDHFEFRLRVHGAHLKQRVDLLHSLHLETAAPAAPAASTALDGLPTLPALPALSVLVFALLAVPTCSPSAALSRVAGDR